MTFIVVGDIDSKEALALIKDNLSKLPANKAAGKSRLADKSRKSPAL